MYARRCGESRISFFGNFRSLSTVCISSEDRSEDRFQRPGIRVFVGCRRRSPIPPHTRSHPCPLYTSVATRCDIALNQANRRTTPQQKRRHAVGGMASSAVAADDVGAMSAKDLLELSPFGPDTFDTAQEEMLTQQVCFVEWQNAGVLWSDCRGTRSLFVPTFLRWWWCIVQVSLHVLCFVRDFPCKDTDSWIVQRQSTPHCSPDQTQNYCKDQACLCDSRCASGFPFKQ